MLTLEEIIVLLQDRNLNEVCRRTNLAYPTVWRLANNKTKNAGYKTVKKLSDYLEMKPGE